MRRVALALPVLLLAGCAPIETAAVGQVHIARGAGITLQVLGPDPAGVEHALSTALLKAGYQPYSAAISTVLVSQPSEQRAAADPLADQEITRRFSTPYLCRLKMTGMGTRVWTFSLQLVEVGTGRILVSVHGDTGGYSPEEIVRAFLDQLNRMAA